MYSVSLRRPIHDPEIMKSKGEAEKEVRSWGFKHVFTWTDSPYVKIEADNERLVC
jgi:hypothetical protein